MYYNFRDNWRYLAEIANDFPALLLLNGFIFNKIGIGIDSREHSKTIRDALITGIDKDFEVFDFNYISTPASSFLARYFKTPFIMVTASHLDYNFNGFKLFRSNGKSIDVSFEKKLIYQLEKKPIQTKKNKIKNVRLPIINNYAEYKSLYLNFIKEYYQGNYICFEVFEEAKSWINNFSLKNVEIISSSIIDPDKRNILFNKTYFSLDPDFDKLLFYINGEFICGNRIIALLSLIFRPPRVVVSNDFSFLLQNFLEKNGLTVLRTEVGDQFVVSKMRKGDLGGESNGHFIIPYTYCPDAILASIVISENIEKIHIIPKTNISKAVITYDDIIILKKDLVNIINVFNNKHNNRRIYSSDCTKIFNCEESFYYFRESKWESSIVIQVEGENSAEKLEKLFIYFAGKLNRIKKNVDN